jgi:cellulose synthase/poly-beta-1,6-N-acetylglucosamine synthase-like glycosyltransferase
LSLRFALIIGIQAVGVLLLLLTLPLTLELLFLTPAACLPPRRVKQRLREQQRLAIVIPAHDEERLIAACVRSLLADRNTWVEVYVVAHNCTDRTAELAAEAATGRPGRQGSCA